MRFAIGVAAMLALAGCNSPPSKAPAASAASPEIMVGDSLDCGKMLHYVQPIYPSEARRKRIQGPIHFRALIGKTGQVGVLEVLAGDPLLVPAALAAVKQWRYAPCILNSEAVEFQTTLTVHFTLNN